MNKLVDYTDSDSSNSESDYSKKKASIDKKIKKIENQNSILKNDKISYPSNLFFLKSNKNLLETIFNDNNKKTINYKIHIKKTKKNIDISKKKQGNNEYKNQILLNYLLISNENRDDIICKDERFPHFHVF